MDSDPVLCPTGQLFRPSYVGWPRCLGNPDPQGTGSPRPSPAALPPETRNRESPSYRAKAVKGVLGPEASVMDSDPQDENGVARRPFSRYPFGHPVQVVHGLAAADCLNSRKHHAYALWGWASPHSRVSTPRAKCLLLPAMWVTCRFNWPFGTRSHRGRVFTDVSRIPFCRHTLENTFIKSTPRFSHRPCRPPLPLSRYYASHCLRRNCTYPGR